MNETTLIQKSWDIRNVTREYATHEFEEGHSDLLVGIIDSGIDVNHPGLSKNINKVYSFVDNDPKVDYTGHGTMVAGQIAGNGLVKGVVPNMQLNSYKIFNQTNKSSIGYLNEALAMCIKDKVNIINMSLGFLIKETSEITGELKELEELIKEINSKNIICVSSIGYSDSPKLKHYPSSFESVLTCKCLSKNLEVINSKPALFCIPTGDYSPEHFLDELVTIYCPMDLSEKMLAGLDFPIGYTYMVGESLASAKLSGIVAAVQSHALRFLGRPFLYNELITILKKNSTLVQNTLYPDLLAILQEIYSMTKT